jgi:OmpR-family two-component system manganese-sensing response regulator
MSIKILLVEDEVELAESLQRVLSAENYLVEIALDGNQALNLALNQVYQLIILDWMLPYHSGLEICQAIRNCSNSVIASTPVLFLTAKDTLDDRVLGLDAGADDYLVKPFELRELLARVRALLRRSGNKDARNGQKRLIVADLELERENQLAYRHGRLIKLSEKEIQLLEFFSQHLHQLVTQEQIYQELWSDNDPPSSNVVAALVRLLRKKIEVKGETPLIHTVYGKGYWFGADYSQKNPVTN